MQGSSSIKKRNLELDFLRFLGVLIIMIAHAKPQAWFSQLRNFGTPLLIVASALTYAFIYKKRTIDLIPFYKKRLSRLTIPAWIFLGFFFSFFYLGSILLNKNYPFEVSSIYNSFLFYNGIGFVWILKVYMILAILTPLGLKFSNSSINNITYFSITIIIYVCYEIGNYFLAPFIPSDYKEFIDNTILLIFPYTALYLYGLRLHLISTKKVFFIIGLSLLIFVTMAYLKYDTSGKFIATQYYKYPPTLYYLSYAFFWVNLLYLLFVRFNIIKISTIKNTVIWLSSNSLWIYLWHILAYYLWEFLFDSFDFNGKFFVKFTFLISIGVIFTYVQISLVKKIAKRDNPILNKILVYLV